MISATTALHAAIAIALCQGSGALPGAKVSQTQSFQTQEVLLNASGRETSLPVLVVLHYSGGTPEEAISDYADVKVPVRVIAIRGNYRKRDGYSYFPVDYYSLPPSRQLEVARKTVAEIALLVERLASAHAVKPVITGISQGGDIAFLMAVEYPRLISAAFPFAATIPPGLRSGEPRACKPPVYMYQGEADPIVNVTLTRKRAARFNHLVALRLETFPGLGHDISPAMRAAYTARLNELLPRSTLPFDSASRSNGANPRKPAT